MYGRKRDKVISIRVNAEQYNAFLETVSKFTEKYTIEYPSRTETRYHTQFPDKPYYRFEKYTLADLVEKAMQEFIEKYKSDV